MKTKVVSIGTDVEFFGEKDSKIIPLNTSIISGTKENPKEINDSAVYLQLDNVLGEVTFEPSYSNHDFLGLVSSARDCVHYYMSHHGILPIYKSSHKFTRKELLSPTAMVFGCEPDFPANYEDPNLPVDPIAVGGLRTASGHIHVGINNNVSAHDVIQYVRFMDFSVGLPLALMHNDPLRRTMYGQAGRFRFKPYGFEYRTPDNWWFGQPNFDLIANLSDVVFNMICYSKKASLKNYVNKHHSRVCRAINEGDTGVMRSFYDGYKGYKLGIVKKFISRGKTKGPLNFSFELDDAII